MPPPHPDDVGRLTNALDESKRGLDPDRLSRADSRELPISR
jgi:hypothetical protein